MTTSDNGAPNTGYQFKPVRPKMSGLQGPSTSDPALTQRQLSPVEQEQFSQYMQLCQQLGEIEFNLEILEAHARRIETLEAKRREVLDELAMTKSLLDKTLFASQK